MDPKKIGITTPVLGRSFSGDVEEYNQGTSFVSLAVEAPINSYVGVARSKAQKQSTVVIPEHCPLGGVWKRDGLKLKRKNADTELFRQSQISKRHRPVSDVVEIVRSEKADGDDHHRFSGITRDALPPKSSFITVMKRGLTPVRLPYKAAKSYAPGSAMAFTHSAGTKNLSTLTPMDLSSKPFDNDVVGTLISNVEGQGLYVHLHPISKNAMRLMSRMRTSNEAAFNNMISAQ